jgi:hypothetical protein
VLDSIRLPALFILALVCCAPATAAQTDSAALVVRTQAQWRAVLASNQKTPLDALTPYGKQVVTDMLSATFREDGLPSLPSGILVRELNREELRAMLVFLDSEAYFAMLERQLVGAPLRMPPSSAVARDWRQLQDVLQSADPSPRSDSATTLASGASVDTYLTLFGDRMREQRLREQPPGDLLLLFNAAAFTNLVNPGSPAFAHLLRVHRELARRGVDTRRGLDDSVLHALIAAREFGQARAFIATRAHLASTAVPQVVDTLGAAFTGRSVFDYDRAAHTLTRKELPVAAGAELVMVVGAHCQPSRRALEALRTDAALRARLQQTGLTIIVPPATAIPFGFVADWNAANPALPMHIPFNHREWASVDVRGVPTFFLLKNGRVVNEVKGWPPEGNADALRAMLDE